MNIYMLYIYNIFNDIFSAKFCVWFKRNIKFNLWDLQFDCLILYLITFCAPNNNNVQHLCDIYRDTLQQSRPGIHICRYTLYGVYCVLKDTDTLYMGHTISFIRQSSIGECATIKQRQQRHKDKTRTQRVAKQRRICGSSRGEESGRKGE